MDQRNNNGVSTKVRFAGHGRGQVRGGAADQGQRGGQQQQRRRIQRQNGVVGHTNHNRRARDSGHDIGRMHRVR